MQLENIKIHYAMQCCDVRNYQVDNRFCTSNRTELSKKSITSFLNSVKNLQNSEKRTHHYIKIVEDSCSEELKQYLLLCKEKYENYNINISIDHLNNAGISESIKYCYEWLENNGENLVYQIQDDYIFTENAIFFSIDMFYQLYQNYNTHPIICPYIDPDFMRTYKGRSIPRLLELGRHSYWIQVYDTSCSFLTSHSQFIQHKDLYNIFYDLVNKKIINGNIIDLENKSLNYMFTQRGVLGVTPITGLTFHMQSEAERDPYIDWKPIWDNIILYD
jgi:hypothetical protein